MGKRSVWLRFRNSQDRARVELISSYDCGSKTDNGQNWTWSILIGNWVSIGTAENGKNGLTNSQKITFQNILFHLYIGNEKYLPIFFNGTWKIPLNGSSSGSARESLLLLLRWMFGIGLTTATCQCCHNEENDFEKDYEKENANDENEKKNEISGRLTGWDDGELSPRLRARGREQVLRSRQVQDDVQQLDNNWLKWRKKWY